MDDKRTPWLRLIRLPGVGPIQQKKFLEHFGTADNIFRASRDELNALNLKSAIADSLLQSSDPDIGRDLEWLERENHHLVTVADADYPALLKEIPDAPVALFVVGNPAVLDNAQIGIVGSRNPSAGGKKTAHVLAAELAAAGLVITSGLALGIDYCGHAGALDAGGKTIAVMGCGLDQVYPARHKTIAGLITENGALISEFPPGTPPLPQHFPRRNRIISGLSHGVIIIEAALQSGSLITARLALEQGREVFAVPGSIYNPLSKGCHYLIREGAKLTESARDVLEEINVSLVRPPVCSNIEGHAAANEAQQYHVDTRQLLEHLSYDPISIDRLIEVSGLTADAVSSMLLVLEVHGIVSSSGGLYTRN